MAKNQVNAENVEVQETKKRVSKNKVLWVVDTGEEIQIKLYESTSQALKALAEAGKNPADEILIKGRVLKAQPARFVLK